MLQIGGRKESSFVVFSFWPGVREVDVEAIHRVVRHEIGYKDGGIGADYPHVCQPESADVVNGVAVISHCPFYAEEIFARQGLCLV